MISSTNVSANVRFSGTKAVYLDRSIEKSLADEVSTNKDISLIREFVNERRAETIVRRLIETANLKELN